MLQQIQPDHQANGFCRTTEIRVQRAQLGFNFCPIDRFGKLPERIFGIAHFAEAGSQELQLITRGFGFHAFPFEKTHRDSDPNLRIPGRFSDP